MNISAGQKVIVQGIERVVEADAVSSELFVRLDNGVKLYYGVFSDDSKTPGKSYWYQQFESADSLIELLGGDVVVDMVNALAAQRQRQRAVNGYNANRPTDSAARAVYDTKECLVDLDDAAGWKPGSRELSITGLGKQVAKLMGEMSKVTSPEQLMKVNAELQSVMGRIAKIAEEQRKLAEAAVGEA